jgi:hypothetical protein
MADLEQYPSDRQATQSDLQRQVMGEHADFWEMAQLVHNTTARELEVMLQESDKYYTFMRRSSAKRFAAGKTPRTTQHVRVSQPQCAALC